MNFDAFKPAPRERSIFRKNLGRALLNQLKDEYLKIWEIDFTSNKSRLFSTVVFFQLRNNLYSKEEVEKTYVLVVVVLGEIFRFRQQLLS